MPSYKLTLARPDELFGTLPDPLSADYAPLSGIERLQAMIGQEKPLVSRHIDIKVEVPNLEPGDDLRLFAAVERYCQLEIEQEADTVALLLQDTKRSLRTGLTILAICLALSTTFAQVSVLPEVLRPVLVEGLIIAGWVAAWHAFDMLFYSRLPHQRKIAVLRKIKAGTWTFVEPTRRPG